ncbi:MAG: DUF1385 domain-containing protein [Bacillota bacterium]|nr:DUF1385 domain-containing protein [Bacillota bacterium]
MSVKKKTSIGGSALIEGVMMRGPSKMGIAIRKPDGDIVIDVSDIKTKNNIMRKIPIIRGMFSFIESMVTSMKALMFSAEFVDIEEEQGSESKFEKWLTKKFGSKLKDYLIYFSVFIAIIFSVGLFFLLPMLIAELTLPLYKNVESVAAVRSIIESSTRIIIFIGYLLLCTMQNDVKRVFMYHGAEHKTIFCYESGLPLTVENCRPQSRLHPRCGTSFLVFVLIISIIVFSFVQFGFGWQRILAKLLCLPLIAGFSYELIKFAGRYDCTFTRILSKPGMWFQHITTKEPDDSMLEIAIASLKAVLPEEGESDKW